MNSAVTIHKNQPLVGTYIIAQGFQREHKQVIKLILKHEKRFLRLNNKSLSKPLIINKLSLKKVGRPIEEYLLNEAQTLFLGTLFRNLNDTILDFKENLALEFVSVKNQLLAIKAHQSTEQYNLTRLTGKVIRKKTTDVIHQFVTYAEERGSSNAKRYYSNITNMENKLLFITKSTFKNLRIMMSEKQLMTLSSADQIIEKALIDGMVLEKPYKEIYKDIKSKISLFAELHGQSDVIDQRVVAMSSYIGDTI